ncbi:hypothetical protein BTO05_12065 [Winogradskyella sp. PC-19]|uniref:T9SS type B sorting domain-containing protein n=1 Tax=unclassified Winogradskyella TaxID=2615021 RepID=UPI000B3D0DB2|nr:MULTISPECIES: T9SS type B sorting domain-containing protein [unclassified Winogradskyella]ARV10339.1 hypothetical protein BTO05_12065 [Winogradskyella sp. PC-19]RZN76915.1 MAG: T9SS type B sorting domain-containing protein [Winogradskyella sp.]
MYTCVKSSFIIPYYFSNWKCVLVAYSIFIILSSWKLTAELSVENPFWDGRYSGSLMPSDDYWFSVNLQDGRVFTKHFVLKR